MNEKLSNVTFKRFPRKLSDDQIQETLNKRFNEGAFSVLLGQGMFNKHIVFNLVIQRSLCGRSIRKLSSSPFRAPIDNLCAKCEKIYSQAYRIWVKERRNQF